MVTTGHIMNRRQIEDAKKLEELEQQEKSLLTQLQSGTDDLDLSSLEGDHLDGGDGGDGGSGEEDEAKKQAEAEAKAAEAEEARKKAEAKKLEEAEKQKKAQQVASKQQPDESDPDFWKKQAETWKKRKGDADRALTPAQEEAAKLRKELEELKSKQQEDRFAALTKEIETLRSALTTGRPAQSQIAEDEALETELSALRAINPEAARLAELEAIRLRKVVGSDNEAIRKELEEVRAAKAQLEAQREQLKADAIRNEHRAFVTSKHPDVDDIYNYAYDALQAWAAEDSPEYLAIVRNPVSVSPQRFSKVIEEFKRYATSGSDSDGSGRSEPAGGDLATRVRKSSAPSKPGSQDPELLSDEEMANFESLMQSFHQNPAKQELLLARLEKTIASMES